MNPADDERRLVEFRGLREAAWQNVQTDLAELQVSITDRGIADRVKDRIGQEAGDVWKTTRSIASENKGIVAATVALLVGWALRKPIGTALAAVFGASWFGAAWFDNDCEVTPAEDAGQAEQD